MNVSNGIKTHINIMSSEIQLNSRTIIKGTVFVQGNPTERGHIVYLFDYKSMRLLQATRCDASGRYAFKFLNPNVRFTIVSKDIDGQYNAVIQDNVVPK